MNTLTETNPVLLTGGTSGIGLAVAQLLATDRRLILAARDEVKAAEVIAGLPNAGQHLIWKHDLTDPDGIEASLTEFLKQNGVLVADLVHAAGVFEVQAARSLELASVRRQFHVNVFSAAEIIRQLVRQKVNKGALRSITLVSSISTRIGAKGYSAYAATKGALVSLARSLAVELAPAVRVNCVSPGGIETPGTQSMFPDDAARVAHAAAYPLGAGSVEDIASAVRFLMSVDARWVTGQELVVDGGRTLL
jgi:NAD(P)-dependent dehydrogenase (short-subunit alcohol dehydrogenase family)